MSEKLQQAITSIKSGNKQQGQQLLAQILQSEPNNESAWLWMSAVVDEDKRKYCIERVLKINPNNQQAVQALNKLNKVENINQQPVPIPATDISYTNQVEQINELQKTNIISSPIVQNITLDHQENEIRYWVNSTSKNTTILILNEKEMLIAEIAKTNINQIQEELKQGIIRTNLLARRTTILYKNTENITKYLISVKVEYGKSDHKETTTIDCKDKETTNAIFEELQKRLGTSFEKSSKTVGAGSFITLFIIFAMILSGITAFLYYAALEVESGVISPTGSARTRGIINLLDLIGSSGVLCIGGVFLIAALALLVYLIAKPPIITELKPKNQFGIEKVKSIESIQPVQPGIPVTEFKEKPNTEIKASSNALIGAALSDGIMAGLIAGLLSIPLPIISILTNRDIYAQYGMYLDGFILLFTGVLTGILFYGRKIGGGGAIALGGAFGGAIAGLISGLMLGYTQQDMFVETAINANTNSITIYMTLCGLIPSITGAILGASTAWLPGIFMKSNEELESPSSVEKIKPSQEQIEKLDTVGARFKQRVKARFWVAAVSIGIVLICSLCQALAN